MLEEEPLVSVEISQDHIAYGKCALAMYLLQQRMGEEVDDLIEIGLFTAEPGGGAFDEKGVIRVERQKVRSGRQVFRFVTDRKPTCRLLEGTACLRCELTLSHV